MKSIRRIVLLSCVSILLAACNGIDDIVESVAYIEVSHSELLLGLNQTNGVSVKAYNIEYYTIPDKEFTFQVEDSSILSYSTSKDSVSLTAIKEGETNLQCFLKENRSLSKTVHIKVTKDYVPQQVRLKDTYKTYIDNYYESISSSPTIGKSKSIIIPVWFTDSSNYITSLTNKENVRNDIKVAYLGSQKDTGWHSVKTYYETESRGKLTVDGFVTDWYECGKSSTNYYNDDYGTKTPGLVNNAFAWFKNKYGTNNLQDYDCDKDGYIDSIMLIYAAPDQKALPSNNSNMWAYTYWMGSEPNQFKPNVNVFFWASYDFMYGKTRALLRAGSTYATGDTTFSKVDTHTFIHEMGHVFGAVDYYDYSNQCNPAAGFSMQDLNVGGHDPYTRMAYGWDKPYVPTQSCQMTVSTYESSGDLVLLSSNPASFSNSPFDEYILLELYSPYGLNRFDHATPYNGSYPIGASDIGFRIWHVDGRILDLTGISDTSQIDDSLIRRGITEGMQVDHAMSNTYYKNNSSSNNYITLLGKNYADYNVLQLIHNNKNANYRSSDNLSNTSLFRAGSTFTIDSYSKQFVKGSKMNDGSSFHWKVEVNQVKGLSAKITLTYVA